MEKSSFFNAVIDQNGIPDRSYLAEDFARYFSTFIGNGVFPNPANQLQVVAVDNNMQIRIKQGLAWINGYFYENTDDYILKLDPADGVLNRIDRIALRLDFLERRIKAIVKKGQYASSPVAPVLQRDSDAYEIAIADVYVRAGVISIMQSNITDTRLNSNVCGIVHGTIKQVDTTEIFRQYQAWFQENKSKHEGDFEKWLTEFKIATGKKFEDWVNDLKNSLDPNEDIAAQLQMQISTIKSQLADITKQQGDLQNLKTIDKTNMVSAVNELFTNVSNGKSLVGTAITDVDKNVIVPTNPTFKQLSDCIKKIETGIVIDFMNTVSLGHSISSAGYTVVGKNNKFIYAIRSDNIRQYDRYGNLKASKTLINNEIFRAAFNNIILFSQGNNTTFNVYDEKFNLLNNSVSLKDISVGMTRDKIITMEYWSYKITLSIYDKLFNFIKSIELSCNSMNIYEFESNSYDDFAIFRVGGAPIAGITNDERAVQLTGSSNNHLKLFEI
ncbi:TPA: hypothetical protein ACX96U_001600 [Clostridium sporogenes]